LSFQHPYDITLVEELGNMDHIVFVDAHADPDRPGLSIEDVVPARTLSFTSHHVIPGNLFAAALNMGLRVPTGKVVAVRTNPTITPRFSSRHRRRSEVFG